MKWKELVVKPDVVGHDKKTGEYIFYDVHWKVSRPQKCLLDREALEARKENKPANSAIVWLQLWVLSF